MAEPCGLQVPSGDLYTLPNGTINLSTCGASGVAGPTAAMCQLQYNTTGYKEFLNYYAVVNNGTQVLTVPRTSSYNVTVAGSSKNCCNCCLNHEFSSNNSSLVVF